MEKRTTGTLDHIFRFQTFVLHQCFRVIYIIVSELFLCDSLSDLNMIKAALSVLALLFCSLQL